MKIIKLIALGIIFVQITISCEKANSKKEFYQSGKIKSIVYYNKDELEDGESREYYEDGNLKTRTKYSNGQIVDTMYSFYESGKKKEIIIYLNDTIRSIAYHENGTIMGVVNGLREIGKVGWLKLYDSIGKLSKQIHYKFINKQSQVNQIIQYGNDDLIMEDESYYVKIDIPDSVELESAHKLLFEYYSPHTNISEVYLVLSNDFNEDFSNMNNVAKDSVPLISGKLEVELTFRKPGIRILRGYFFEKYVDSIRIHKNDEALYDATIFERKIFFDDSIKVFE